MRIFYLQILILRFLQSPQADSPHVIGALFKTKMKYSEEIKAAVKAIEHDIAYFASGIRLQYPDKTFEEVKRDIMADFPQQLRVDAPKREAEE